MDYFSARLQLVCIADNTEHQKQAKQMCDFPFFVFRAEDEETAFQSALELGRNQEHEYQNDQGELVRWRLRAVEQIWRLGQNIDGREIGSLLDVYFPETPLAIDHEFRPESKTPIYSDERYAD